MKNVLEFIERSAEKYPDKLSVADINGGLTYKELEQTAKHTACTRLRSGGIFLPVSDWW